MTRSPALRPFFLLLVLGLTARGLAWWFLMDHPARFLSIDSFSYLEPARALLEFGRFSISPQWPDVPQLERTPGYSLWLAFWMGLFKAEVRGLVAAQLLLSAATIALTYHLGERLFGPRAGLAAATFVVLDPVCFLYGLKILTEPLATLTTLLFVWAVLGFIESEGNPWAAGAAGGTLALAVLVRPTPYYFFPLLMLGVLVFYLCRGRGWRTALKGAGWVALPFILLVGGWILRNVLVADMAHVVNVRGDYLYLWKGAHIVADRDGIPFSAAQKKLEEAINRKYPGIADQPQKQRTPVFMKELKDLIRQHPGIATKTQLRQMALFFFAPGTTAPLFRLLDPEFRAPEFDWNRKGRYFAKVVTEYPAYLMAMGLGMAYLALLYGFAGVGIFCPVEGGKSEVRLWFFLFALVFLLYVAGISSVVAGDPRYRVVVGPLMALFAGAGVSRLTGRKLN